jgi:hypothetical protein
MTNTIVGHATVGGHASPTAPPMVMVFWTRDGRISHARCGQPLEFQGRRAGLELDFYCQRCVEHVTLPECILSRIPLEERVPMDVTAKSQTY